MTGPKKQASVLLRAVEAGALDRFALGRVESRKRRRNADAALAVVERFLGERLAPTTATAALSAYVAQFDGLVPITAEASRRWTLLSDLEKAVDRLIERCRRAR